MIYLAYISIFLLGGQFINVLINMLFRQNMALPEADDGEPVSILIPARNEEQNISQLLSDLQKLQSQTIEIIVFDDESTDRTADIVEDFASRDKRINLIQSEGLPEAWLGKNHACFQLAKKATGNYFLFLDADVRLDPLVITDAVSYAKSCSLSLLSVFPVQIQKSFSEKISVPLMNYILLTLLPLVFVRFSPFASHSAANGQFMLFDAETYKNIQPHKQCKKSVAEDIAIASLLKKQNFKIACITGEKRIQCRMYKTYAEAVSGFSKNIFTFFAGIPVLAFLFGAFSAFGFIPVLMGMPQYLIYYFAAELIILVLYSSVSKQNIAYSIVLYPLQVLFLFKILGNAALTRKQQALEWKERNIYL